MAICLKMNVMLQKGDLISKKESESYYGIKNRSIISCRIQSELPIQKKKKNLYQVLSLEYSRSVSFDEVKKAYRMKALQLHPDVCPSTIREECTKQFVELQKAYEVLSDPISRRRYDNELCLIESFGCYDDDEQKGKKFVSRNVWEMQLAGLKNRSADRLERMKNKFM